MKRLIISIIALLGVMMPSTTMAQGIGAEPYAVLSDDGSGGKVLTFYYNSNKESNDYTITSFNSASDRGWHEQVLHINKVVIHESFADYSPTSTAYWFYDMEQLTSIEGLEYINTSSTTDMRYMFYNCFELVTLDIRTFNTANVTDMEAMFCGDGNLTTIIAGNQWTTDAVVNSTDMFSGCTNLEGGRGTWHVFEKEDHAYARIDKAPDYPGYFTATFTEHAVELKTSANGTINVEVSSNGTVVFTKTIPEDYETEVWVPNGGNLTLNLIPVTNYDVSIMRLNTVDITSQIVSNVYTLENVTSEHSISVSFGTLEAYAVLNNDYSILTFYYDRLKEERGGMGVGPFNTDSERGWHSFFGNTTKVVIDPSFADYRPTSTAYWFDTAGGINVLSSIEGLEYINTSQVTDMRNMFSHLKLKNLDLRHFDTSNVKDMSWLFAYCDDLESLNLSGFSTSNVKNMSYMFFSCGLSSLDLSSFNTAQVTDMSNMFTNDSQLVTIYVGSDWTTSAVTNGDNVFVNCERLVGGAGTIYSVTEPHTGVDYAHIDGGTYNPGYLTDISDKDKIDEPYAVLTDNDDEITTNEGTIQGKTLTFYYDKQKVGNNGMGTSGYPWLDNKESITKVVFNESFANCITLTSTASWFNGCKYLTEIKDIINLKTDNVTDMSQMFRDCSGLTSLDVSGFNTENVTNLKLMFDGCSGLTTLDLSGFKTENVTDMSYMFRECTSLKNIDLSGFKTGNVIDMWAIFAYCLDLKTIFVGADWDTSAVTNWSFTTDANSNMFKDCTSLVGGAGTIYDADHIDVTYAHIDGGADNPGYFTSIADKADVAEVVFHRNVLELTLECATENVEIYYNFSTEASDVWHKYTAPITLSKDCIITAYAKRPSGISSVQTSYTFSMSDVQKVDTPTSSWNGDVLTLSCLTDGATIYYTNSAETAATGAVSPTIHTYEQPFEVTLDALFEVWATKAGMQQSDTLIIDYNYTAWNALKEAINNAKSVASQAATNNNVTDAQRAELASKIVSAEESCAARTESVDNITQMTNELITLTEAVNVILQAVNEPYAVLSDGSTKLTFYYDTQKEARNGMNVVEPYSFQTSWNDFTDSITKVVFDASFAYCTTLTSTASWFWKCYNLTDIEGIENLKTDNVTNMSWMFRGCSGLTSIDVSNFKTDNVTDMNCMFEDCSSLSSLDVSNFKTDNVTDMQYMFFNCSSLKSLDLSNFKTDNVTNMQQMFWGGAGLTSLNVSSFNTGNVTNMDSMFEGCSSLTNLDVSSFKTNNVTSMRGMFRSCSSLTNLDISTFNTGKVSLMDFLFYDCSGLNTIYIGDGWDTSEVIYGGEMFIGCINLVGGMGTTFDENCLGVNYAHVDGGSANPGYFTDINDKNLEMGDANGDGYVNIADATTMISYILSEPIEGRFITKLADMNNDNEIDIFDITLVVNKVLTAEGAGSRVATRANADFSDVELMKVKVENNNIYLSVDQAERFTAFQFDVQLPERVELTNVKLASGITGHQLQFVKHEGNKYRVVGLSFSNKTLVSSDGKLIQLQVSAPIGLNDVVIDKILFATKANTVITGIGERQTYEESKDDVIYDLKGQMMGRSKQKLSKGVYIINRKKVIIK